MAWINLKIMGNYGSVIDMIHQKQKCFCQPNNRQKAFLSKTLYIHIRHSIVMLDCF